MNIFVIEASNGLRFVNRTKYSSTLNTFDTRLFPHIEFQDRSVIEYHPKIEQEDDTWVQFKTSFEDFNINLVDPSDFSKTVISYSAPIYSYDEDGTTINVYNTDIDLSSVTGCYYIEFELFADGLRTRFWSETFNVQEEHPNTSVCKWGGNSSIQDGMRWASVAYEVDRYQQIRIDARIIEPLYDAVKSNYDDSDMESTTLKDEPTATHTLDIKEIPFYLHEKINLGLGHDEFYVNDVLYNIDEGFELISFKEQLMRSGSIPLRKVEYENPNNYEDLEGETFTLPQGYLLINDTDYLIINAAGDKLKINN